MAAAAPLRAYRLLLLLLLVAVVALVRPVPAPLLPLWLRARRDEGGAGGRGLHEPAEALASRLVAVAQDDEEVERVQGAQDVRGRQDRSRQAHDTLKREDVREENATRVNSSQQREDEYEETEQGGAADGPGIASTGAGSNAAYAALISWPALPSFAPLIEGSVLVPTWQGRGTRAAGQRERAIIVLQWDPVDGALGLSLSAWPQPSAADRAAVGVALAACGPPCRGDDSGGGDDGAEGDLVHRWVADAQVQLMVGARVDGGEDPHGPRWFLLLPATQSAEAQAACLGGNDDAAGDADGNGDGNGDGNPAGNAAGNAGAVEAKALPVSARAAERGKFAFATATDLGLLLIAAARCGALRRCGARLLRGSMRWGQGDLEADVTAGRFWPCEGAAAVALALQDATRAHTLLTAANSTDAVDESARMRMSREQEPLRRCRTQLAALLKREFNVD